MDAFFIAQNFYCITQERPTMTDHLQAATPSRRDFLKTCAAGVSASAITTLIPAGVKSR